MATVVESRRPDEVEAALAALDRDFASIYGPDMGAWSRGVRGEYLETIRAHRTVDREAHPLHPRKASASRRRRHLRRLAWRVNAIAPGAVTVLLNPYWSDCHGPSERVYVVTARDAAGDRIQLPAGGSRRLASLMQGAYPAANWNTTQTWRADTHTLTSWRAGGRAS